MISLITAINKLNYIGKNNDLLYKIPGDLEYFKQITLGKTIVMGYKTFLSLPNGALPGRRNVILSRNKDLIVKNCIVYNDINELIKKEQGNFIVIGGGEIYNLFLPFVKRLYITQINDNMIGDVKLPEYKGKFRLLKESDKKKWKGIEYTFQLWER